VMYISGYARQLIPVGEVLVSKPFELADLATKLREVLSPQGATGSATL
jgi:hypothetical protein